MLCGVIPDDQEVYKQLSRIVAEEIESDEEAVPPPRKERKDKINGASPDDSEDENREGEWIRVAGDGACPGGGSKDYRIRKSGSGLYYGKQ